MTDRHEDAAVSLQYELTEIGRVELGFTEQYASQIADVLVRGLRERIGGEGLYIPVKSKRQRDEAIYREHLAGVHFVSICRRYDISKTRLYEIIKKMRALSSVSG